jgi:hypothetical protein
LACSSGENRNPLAILQSRVGPLIGHRYAARKDGYLATNSLVFDATVIARTYGELDRQGVSIDYRVDQIVFGELSLADWIQSSAYFVEEAAKRGSLIIVFSPNLRPIAEDLESKLSINAFALLAMT